MRDDSIPAEPLATAPAASPGADSPWVSWGAVAVLLLCAQLSITDRQILSLLVDPIKRDLGLTDTQLGLLQGFAFAIVYSVAGLPIGWAVDRAPRRIILFLGVMVWSLSTAACGLARSFPALIIPRATVGAGEAAVAPVSVSLIGDLFPPQRAGLALGVYAAGFSVGSGVALALGGLIFGLFGGRPTAQLPLIGQVWTWQAVFLALGAPGVLAAFLAFAIREPPRPRRKGERGSPGVAELPLGAFIGRRWRVVALVYGGFALTTLVAYAVSGWTPAFLGRTFGWSTGRIGAVFGAVVMAGGLAGSLLGGWCIDWLHRRGREDACLLVGAVACALATPLLVGAYWLPSPGLVLLALGFGLAAAQASGPAAYASLRLIAPPHLRGRLTAGFVLVASLLGTGLGPLAVGLATDFILGDERRVGAALSIVVMAALPNAAALLALAHHAWRARAPLELT